MTQQDAGALYDQGKEAVLAYLVQITNRVKALEARLNQNSQNSSKPPSSDPPERKMAPMSRPNRSLRKKTGRKPGGQKGHEGNTLR